MFEEEGEESHVCWDEGIRGICGIRGFAGNSGVNPGKLKGFLPGDSVWDKGGMRGKERVLEGLGMGSASPELISGLKMGFFN